MGELEGVEDDESSEGEIIDDDDEDSSDDGDEDREQLFCEILERKQLEVSSNADLCSSLPPPFPPSSSFQTCTSTRPSRMRIPSRQLPSPTFVPLVPSRRTRSSSLISLST